MDRTGRLIEKGMHVRTADGHIIGAISSCGERGFVVEHPNAKPGANRLTINCCPPAQAQRQRTSPLERSSQPGGSESLQ